MGVEIKVTTQELKNAAANIRGITERIQNLYARISEESLKFPAQWEGEAETMHRQKLQAALDRAKKAGDELKKRPDRPRPFPASGSRGSAPRTLTAA